MVEFIDPSLLPPMMAFVFVFALVFGLLGYVNRFDRKSSLLIAAAFGFFSVMFDPFVAGVQTFLPIAAIIFAILFFLLIIKEVFKSEEGKKLETLPLTVGLALFLLLIGVLWPALGIDIAGVSSTNILWIIGVTIILLIFFAVYKHQG